VKQQNERARRQKKKRKNGKKKGFVKVVEEWKGREKVVSGKRSETETSKRASVVFELG